MKATGVVRRIDELGRIVIPKEIRRTLKIKEGTPLEIYSGECGELILKKYSPILEISDFADEIAQSISESINANTLITNMEKVIASAGVSKNTYLGKEVDSLVEKTIQSRQSKIFLKSEVKTLIVGDNISSFVVCPICQAGDAFGAIIIFRENLNVNESDIYVAKSFADFLGKQVGWYGKDKNKFYV